ncbi:MAG: thioredoxin [Pseudomonadota bacterium]
MGNTTSLIEINKNNFEQEVIKSEQPVLVDFWAEWCGPCKMIAPILEELAQEYANQVKFAKINIDDNASVATEFNVRSIPTLKLFNNGEVKATQIGALTKSQVKAFIDSNI